MADCHVDENLLIVKVGRRYARIWVLAKSVVPYDERQCLKTHSEYDAANHSE